eukprot:103789_1
MTSSLATIAILVSAFGKQGGVFAKMIRAKAGKMPHRTLEEENNITQPSLVLVSKNRWGGTPLGPCEGDCDKDSECMAPLRCFNREHRSTGMVPFCEGGESIAPGKDYCTGPGWLLLFKVANKGIRDDGLLLTDHPLGMCEGHCQNDDQCGPGLACFQRDGDAGVPSCVNWGGIRGVDYCVAEWLV